MRNIKCFSFFKMKFFVTLSFFVAILEIHKGLRFVCMKIIWGRQILFTNYSVLMNGIFCHTQRLQFFKVHLTWLTARCIIHANYNPLSFVTMSALAYFLHFCAVESTLTRCMSLSFTFEFLFPKIWDRSLLVIHPLNREPIYQQPLRMNAYRHAFQFGMNNEWQFVLNKRIMALEGGKGVLGPVHFSWYVPQAS